MARAIGELYEEVADEFIAKYSANGVPPPEKARQELLGDLQKLVVMHNAAVGSRQFRMPNELPSAIISAVIREFYPVKMISIAGKTKREDCFLFMYCDSGANRGVYTQSDSELYALVKKYKFDVTQKEFKEIKADLEMTCEILQPDNSYDSTIVENGIFNFTTGKLEEFTPNRVFLSKPSIGYYPTAQNVFITNPDGSSFDVDSWLAEIADDPDITDLFWQIINSVLRRVSNDVMILFYAPSGCNGKGTFLSLLRNIVGEDNCASIPLDKWGEKFDTSMLIGKMANFVDENAVKGYAASIDSLKASITNDVLTVQAKHKDAVSIHFRGTQIFCVNSLVRIGDGTDSAYRRILTVPFEKSFTGKENKLIKRDYLCRTEVLEYVVKKALEMGVFDEYSVPTKCEELKRRYMRNNDAVRDFVYEIVEKCVWDMIPNPFAYDLYKAWYRRNCTGQYQGRNTFLESFRRIMESDFSDKWRPTRQGGESAKNYITVPEPMILEFDLRNWYDKGYYGLSMGSLATKFEGFVRL